MNASTKTLLTLTILSTLGLGVIVETAYASQSKQTTITHQGRTSNPETPKVSNSNSNIKTKPTTQRLQPSKQHQTQETDKNEANEGPNDSDGGAKEDSH
jgi:hypothetical protein